MGVIMYNGESSVDYGILVEHPPGYRIAQRDYEKIHIPGRNGDLIIDNGSYQNVPVTYQIAVGNRKKAFVEMANKISEWLNSASGYARLEDSYEPEYYRLAAYQDETDIENILFHAGRTTINFDCKPQRFLKSGDEVITLTQSAVIMNPTRFEALPIITVYGSGSGIINVAGNAVSISNIDGYIVINSEIQDAYKGSANKNSVVTFGNNNEFPVLGNGQNVINISGGITKVEVVPKWWTL